MMRRPIHGRSHTAVRCRQWAVEPPSHRAHLNPQLPTIQVLLGTLPPNRNDWAASEAKARADYDRFVNELIIVPSRDAPATANDHPLALEKGSTWNQYFKVSYTWSSSSSGT